MAREDGELQLPRLHLQVTSMKRWPFFCLIIPSLRCWKPDLGPGENCAPNPRWHFKNERHCSAWPAQRSADLLVLHGWHTTGFPQLRPDVLLGCLSHLFHGTHSHCVVVKHTVPQCLYKHESHVKLKKSVFGQRHIIFTYEVWADESHVIHCQAVRPVLSDWLGVAADKVYTETALLCPRLPLPGPCSPARTPQNVPRSPFLHLLGFPQFGVWCHFLVRPWSSQPKHWHRPLSCLPLKNEGHPYPPIQTAPSTIPACRESTHPLRSASQATSSWISPTG